MDSGFSIQAVCFCDSTKVKTGGKSTQEIALS